MSIEKRVRKQMELIISGTVEVIPEEEMRRKVGTSLATGRPLTVKLGVDPTCPDLHIGHSVPLTKLRHFQQLGHQVVLIIGDFTALIGDPSYQDVTRPVLTEKEIERNARTYIEQAERVIDTTRARVVRNSQWLSPLNFKEVLEITSRFTVARILERDDFSNRYSEGKPIGLHEFLYPVMQAYDSVVIEADIEIGGTDQKFNLLAGRNLQRAMGKEPQCILTLPLLEGTDGVRKMSKSLDNDVGLTDPPDEMFGKLMSIPDGIMWEYFRLATRVEPVEIERLKARVESGEANPRDVKERLAVEIVGMYHGPGEAERAATEFRRVFSMRGLPERIKTVEIPRSRFSDGGMWVVDLVVSLGFVSSNGEARRLIAQGGLTIEGEKVEDADLELAAEQVDGKVVRKGKKTFARVELV